MSQIWMGHDTDRIINILISWMNESRHTYEWVTSHIWMSHVTHMNESCHTSEYVMAQTKTWNILTSWNHSSSSQCFDGFHTCMWHMIHASHHSIHVCVSHISVCHTCVCVTHVTCVTCMRHLLHASHHSLICVKCLIYSWHDASIGELTYLHSNALMGFTSVGITCYMRDMTHLYVLQDSFIREMNPL